MISQLTDTVDYGFLIPVASVIEVTEEMKGKKLPIFTGLEIKLPKGYPSIQQRNFAAMLRDFNGIASEKITSFEGIENLIEQYK